MSKSDLERRIEAIVKEELHGSALYLADGKHRKMKSGSGLYYQGDTYSDSPYQLGSGLRYEGNPYSNHGNIIGGLMMADGKKSKHGKSVGEPRGDGGKALKKFNKKLDKVRKQHPHLSFRECQQIAKEL